MIDGALHHLATSQLRFALEKHLVEWLETSKVGHLMPTTSYRYLSSLV